MVSHPVPIVYFSYVVIVIDKSLQISRFSTILTGFFFSPHMISFYWSNFFEGKNPLRIRGIEPQHTLACRKRRLNGNSWGSGLEKVLRISLRVVRGDLMCHSRRGTINSPLAQRQWTLSICLIIGNGDISIYVRNSWARRKSVND
jgi:hypothetical protein